MTQISPTLDDLRQRYPDADAYAFGDTKELSDWLLSLVLSGQKTATCGALHSYKTEGWPLPIVGRRDIILDFQDRPAGLVENTEVETTRFCDVTEDFALAEGETDTLEGWRAGHKAYFERNGGWQEDMPLVCIRFRLIESYPTHTGQGTP